MSFLWPESAWQNPETRNRRKKKPPEKVAEREDRKERKPVRVTAERAAEASRISEAAYFVNDVFAADARIIRSGLRAVKSTLTMLVIGDGTASQ